MKRKLILLNIIMAIILVFAVSVHATFCTKCGTNNAEEATNCSSCGEKIIRIEGKDIYDQSCEMFRQEKYDEVISSLVGYCTTNPEDRKSEILLAKAYLEKCDLLKEQHNQEYKSLVYKPLEIGRKIIAPRDQYLSEGLYICGRSFLINHRAVRAARYIKKAFKFSTSPPAEYFIALGDAQFAMGKNDDAMNSDDNPNYFAAKITYNKVVDMEFPNNEKGKAYYKLGVLYLSINEKIDAKQAFESALQVAETDSLISRIRSKLGTL